MDGVFQNVLELVGNTPMVELSRVLEAPAARLLAKLESVNPSGSIKDRVALAIVEAAEAQGELTQGDTLVWATGGNSGAALAMVAAAKGYHLIIFMPSNAPLRQRRLAEHYGAEIQLTAPAAGMRGSQDAARRLTASEDNLLLVDLFRNPQVVEAHRRRTAEEILRATEGKVDAFVAAVGTGGTLSGVGQRLKQDIPSVQVVAVEPAGSPVISGGNPGRHMIPGIGADFVPPLLDRGIIDSVVLVTDDEATQMAMCLARREGLLVGTSSGANVFAAGRVARELGPGKTVVTVLPDTGERHLDFPA